MSQNFNDRFSQFMSGNATQQDDPEISGKIHPDIEYYTHNNGVRNVCFVLLNDNRIFLNYGYLVSCEFMQERNEITMGFTTHTVKLRGIRLLELFEDFQMHTPRIIRAKQERYNDVGDEKIPIVNKIEVYTFDMPT